MPRRVHHGMKRTLFALGFVLPLGCVLLVDDVETFGKDCPIQGADTVCGTCLRANCQAAINACCGDSKCDTTRIDQCALGACTAQFQGQAWEHCALSMCGTACGLVLDGGLDGSADAPTDVNDAAEDSFTPPTVTGCTTSFNSCSCAAGASPNGVVCDKTRVENGYCCADASWPAFGNCRCQKLSCETISGDCECGIVQDGALSSCQPTTSLPNCCARPDFGTCLCSKKICESWVGNPVVACTPETTPCPNGGKSVTSCSY